jgi:hypothetical protein
MTTGNGPRDEDDLTPAERRRRRREQRRRGDGDSCDCDACDFFLVLRLSTVLSLLAALVPARAGRRPVLALLGLYRRRLTRFTPACPSTPSCSAYAVRAVRDLGARQGLAAAARRVRRCG